MKKKPTNEIELSTLVNEAETELLKQKQAAIRERAKPILKHREAMEKSIAECEKDLEKARLVLADFALKIRDMEENDNMQLFEELEKIVREGETKLYVRQETATSGYCTTGLVGMLNAWPTYTLTCGSTSSTAAF